VSTAALATPALRKTFSEDGQGQVACMLDTARLKKLLLVVVRNHTTGSQWPLTNNLLAMFNDRSLADCNLNIPLWKVVRASTAAPVYFDPEVIELGGKPYVFVDGAVTPYNNPALIAALTAVLPCYRVDWTPGPENIRLVSVGTMRFSTALTVQVGKLWVGNNVSLIPSALIHGIAWQQDYLCRCLGECIFGDKLDSEVGDLVGARLPGSRWFSYVRYNKTYNAAALAKLVAIDATLSKLDAVQAIPFLRESGQAYANENVKIEHLI